MATSQTTSRWMRQAAPTAVKCCDLCNDRRFDLVSSRDRHGKPLHTAMCMNCGLVCHRQSYHGETTPSPRRVMRAWNNGQRIFRQLQGAIPKDAKVFEVGAGIGCNIKSFELAGYDAQGIDPGEGFVAYSRQRLHTRLQVGNLYDVAPQPQFDLVLLVHVIEHFCSPRRALSHIRQMLRPNGRLYVECPNLTAPLAPFSHMFHYAHVHNFNPATLRMMAEQTGFEVEQVYSRDDDPNLQMLLKCGGPREPMIERANVVATWSALRQSKNSFRYHARPVYLGRRIAKIAGYGWEHLVARRVVRKLEQRCQDHAAQAATKF